jgi:hypothetical protein
VYIFAKGGHWRTGDPSRVRGEERRGREEKRRGERTKIKKTIIPGLHDTLYPKINNDYVICNSQRKKTHKDLITANTPEMQPVVLM